MEVLKPTYGDRDRGVGEWGKGKVRPLRHLPPPPHYPLRLRGFTRYVKGRRKEWSDEQVDRWAHKQQTVVDSIGDRDTIGKILNVNGGGWDGRRYKAEHIRVFVCRALLSLILSLNPCGKTCSKLNTWPDNCAPTPTRYYDEILYINLSYYPFHTHNSGGVLVWETNLHQRYDTLCLRRLINTLIPPPPHWGQVRKKKNIYWQNFVCIIKILSPDRIMLCACFNWRRHKKHQGIFSHPNFQHNNPLPPTRFCVIGLCPLPTYPLNPLYANYWSLSAYIFLNNG